jgi:CubicO group peptidase (beta-lactamase class C family)
LIAGPRWTLFAVRRRASCSRIPRGLPNYFTDQAFAARLREDPGRAWRPAELVDHAATYGTPRFPPGRGFEYCDTGYVATGILVEQAAGQPLHQVYRELVFDPAGMDSTWLEGYEPARQPEAAHHYTGELDWTTISPTIDWAGGGLVTTAPDLARFVRALWSEQIIGSPALGELTRWTPAATFPPGHMLRYERYGLGMGANTVEGVELLGTPASSGPSHSTPPDMTRCWPAPTTTRRSTAGHWRPRSAGNCARQPDEHRR